MTGLNLADVTLAIIVGTLAAIVYSIRILVIMERRVARVEQHIENIASKVLKEELLINKRISPKKSTKKPTRSKKAKPKKK